jgi:PAS domain S-box-containing protein
VATWPLSTASLRKAGTLALLLALSALAAIAFFSEREWSDFAQSRREGQLSNRILNLNRNILGWVGDAETGQRGYLLTGRAEYLDPYKQAVLLLPANLQELRDAVAAQAVLRGRVQQLENLVGEKLAEIKLTMEMRDSQGLDATLAVVASGRGERLMRDIREVSGLISAEAEQQVTRSRTAISMHSAQARFVTISGVALLAILVIGAFAANERSARQRESLIEELAEANRRSSEVRDLLRTTFYSIGDGVVTTDASGVVELMNSRAEKLTGWSEAEARGKPVEQVFQVRVPGAREVSASPVKAALTGGVLRRARPQSVLTAKTGAEFQVEASAAPIRDARGVLCGAVLVIHDVTDLRHGEERLRQVAKLESLGILAGGIAHDFNNLLVGIVGASSLLEEYFPPEAPGWELIQTLQNAGNRAAQLTNQMLAYSGRGRFVVRPLDVSKEVEEIVALLTASISKNVELRLSLVRDLPKVDADAAQLQQLIMNLVLNGAEAVGDARGAVAVSTSVRTVAGGDGPANVMGVPVPAGVYALLSVSDTGQGMDDATRARIFDPFFTTKFTGRGLGLAAALGIVKGHGGAIEVESAPGQGATFRVYLPVSEGGDVE